MLHIPRVGRGSDEVLNGVIHPTAAEEELGAEELELCANWKQACLHAEKSLRQCWSGIWWPSEEIYFAAPEGLL